MFKRAEEDGGSGARGAGEWRLIDELDSVEFFDTGQFGGCGFIINGDAEMASEVVVDDGVSEGGFSRAGDASEADKDAEGEIEVEV